MRTVTKLRSSEAMRITVSSLFPVLGFLTAMAGGQQNPYRDLRPCKGKRQTLTKASVSGGRH